jgi:hypothetical protein
MLRIELNGVTPGDGYDRLTCLSKHPDTQERGVENEVEAESQAHDEPDR